MQFLRIHCFQLRVRVHHPLKQGLRQRIVKFPKLGIKVRTSASSIKTRIKTRFVYRRALKPQVRVHHPLKQGLRRVNS